MKAAYAVFMLCCAAYFSSGVLRAMLQYGVNVPFWDQWDLVRALHSMETGDSSWIRLLFLRVGEHRIATEWLASLAWWKLTGMELRAEMVFNWATALAFCLLAWAVTRRALPAGSAIPWTVLATASLFIFNPAAFQVWLWGLPLVHALVPLLFLLGVAVAQSQIREGVKPVLMALCALVASFTLASGPVLWILFVPVLVCYLGPGVLKRNRISLAIAAALMAFTAAVFAVDRGTSPVSWVGLRTTIGFFVVYTGNLVAQAREGLPLLWAQAAGAGLLLFFGAAVWLSWLHLRGQPQWRSAVVWGCLGCYSLAAGMMAAVGRAGFGLGYAIESSRYVLASSFLPIACVALGSLLTARVAEVLPKRISLYSWVLCATVAVVLAGGGLRFLQTNRSLATMLDYSQWMKQGQVALAAVNIYPMPEYRKIYSSDNPTDFRVLANYLNRRGWLHPPLWNSEYLRRLAAPSLAPDPSVGRLDEVHRRGMTLHVAGQIQAADAVMVLESVPDAAPQVLGVVFPSGSRWSTDITLQREAPPGSRIRCFAYHADSGKASLMSGM